MSEYSGQRGKYPTDRNGDYMYYPHSDNYINNGFNNEPPADYHDYHDVQINVQKEETDNSDLDSTGKKRTLARLCGRFADKTSMQGVNYINTAKLTVAKVLWSILLLIAIGWMTAHLYYLISQFLEWPVQTKISLSFSNLKIPAVTLCNVNVIRKSKINYAAESLQALAALTDPSRFDPRAPPKPQPPGGKTPPGKKRKKRFVSDFKNVNFDNFTDYGDYVYIDGDSRDAQYELEETFRDLYMQEVRETRVDMGHQIDEMLLLCSFNGFPCYSENFTLIQTEDYGNCFMLDTSSFTVRNSGPKNGLIMILYTENEEYLDGINQGYGLRVAIHEPKTYPLPSDHGVFISSNTETHIGLKLTNITRRGGLYGNCTDGVAFKETYGIKYTRAVCQLLCEQSKIYEKCGCFEESEQELFYFGKKRNVKICRSRQELKCQDEILRNFLQKDVACDCVSPCAETQYTLSMSSRQWPTDSYSTVLMQAVCDSLPEKCTKVTDMTDPRLITLNFIKLAVYYEDLNYQAIQEEPEIEVYQFASDVGGAIGLWIGLSILSMFEIFQLLTEVVSFLIHKCRRGGKEKEKRKKYVKKAKQQKPKIDGEHNGFHHPHPKDNYSNNYSNWMDSKY